MLYRGTVREVLKNGYLVEIPEIGLIEAEVCKIKGIDVSYIVGEVVYAIKVGDHDYAILGCLQSNSDSKTTINTERINAQNGKIEKVSIGTTDSDTLGKVAYYFNTTLEGGKKNA